MRIGTGDNGEFTLLDIIAIASFLIGVENLDENITQNDLSEQSGRIMTEIHQHLEEQDRKIERILELLEAKNDL